MKVEYTAKTINTYESKFTKGKVYNVLADYRNRKSGQDVYDSGFIIKDDNGDENIVSPYDVKIVDDTKGDTFVFEVKEDTKEDKEVVNFYSELYDIDFKKNKVLKDFKKALTR